MTDLGRQILRLVEAGKSEQEIMKELKIRSRNKLRALYYEALAAEGKVKPIPQAPKERVIRRKIGKRGTILLSRTVLIDQLGFKQGDTFVVRREGNRIVLERVG